MLTRLCKLTALATLLSPLSVGPAMASDPNEPSDISAIKPKLKVLEDGKKHYIVLEPFGDSYEHFYYGDGKDFYLQRVRGGGRSGNESFDRSFWEPRSSRNSSFGFRNGKYTLDCGERQTELKPVADAEAPKILDAAKFWKVRWKRQAYALARDNTGQYYYVDRMREPEGNKNFRLFTGPKGSMKLTKLTNTVSDSAGDIFSTKTGELRLVLNKKETFWQKGKKKTDLIFLPAEDNHVMIYTELGVYADEKLGTPCDDL
jgi:hypothetical protein